MAEHSSRRRVAVVTGASAGVGRATAVALAARGFDVGLVARGEAGLEAAAKDVESQGARALVLGADVADYDQVEAAAARAESELGPIEVWINNAMTTVFAPFWQTDPADFERALRVTFLGQVWGTRAALDRMLERDRGAIVNVGSALSFMGIPLQSAYCSSKFACRGFFESTRAELLHRGSRVRMSMVHLPAVNTPQFGWCESVFDRHPQPVPPIYEPEIPARAIVAAALDGRRSRVVGSWNKLLVGASKFIPGVGNHFAALGAWESQLTDQPVSADRPVNLRRPVDAEADWGAHGIFGEQAQGFFSPSFLKTLPRTGSNFARALGRTAREKAGIASRRVSAG